MKPPIQIVNEADELIGHVSRSEADYSKIIYRVSALWLTNSKDEVLIAQRKLTKDRDPGRWGPAVAGTIDEGETYESNIYKEAEEEIGLTGLEFTHAEKMHVTEPRNYFCQWFTGTLDRDSNEFVLQEDEVESVKWVAKTALRNEVSSDPERFVPHMPLILDLFHIGDPS